MKYINLYFKNCNYKPFMKNSFLKFKNVIVRTSLHKMLVHETICYFSVFQYIVSCNSRAGNKISAREKYARLCLIHVDYFSKKWGKKRIHNAVLPFYFFFSFKGKYIQTFISSTFLYGMCT